MNNERVVSIAKTLVHETKDMFGCVIKRGDIIAYPVRQGSYMGMRAAVVTDLHYNPDAKYYEDKEWANIITLVDGAWDTLTKQYFPKERKTRFSSFTRAIVVDESMLVDQWKPFGESKNQLWQQRLVNLQKRIRGE